VCGERVLWEDEEWEEEDLEEVFEEGVCLGYLGNYTVLIEATT
jgi:hypothetical protein